MGLYQFFIEPARTYEEMLMTDYAIVTRDGVPVIWPRNGQMTVPCRVSTIRTEAVVPDPQDANIRSYNEWAFTMPWDIVVLDGDEASVYLNETGESISSIVGETNNYQTWKIATRCYGTVQKNAVQITSITLTRDDGEGNYSVVGTYNTRVIRERVNPITVPLRFSIASRGSLVPVRIIFDDFTADVQIKDEFVLDGHWGIIREVFPGQPQRLEALAFVDFGGIV